MSIKKPFVSLVTFLENNKDETVSSILEEVLLMCESKKTTSTVMVNSDNKVIAIFCYYHKQWELLSDVAYGSKINTTSGLNTMCKIGVSKWTKKQRDSKKSKEELLTSVASGDIQVSDILKLQEDIEVTRLTMDTDEMPVGYTSEEEVLEAIEDSLEV